MLRVFLGYNAKRENCSYVEGTIMSIARLILRVAIMVRCLVQKEMRGGQLQI